MDACTIQVFITGRVVLLLPFEIESFKVSSMSSGTFLIQKSVVIYIYMPGTMHMHLCHSTKPKIFDYNSRLIIMLLLRN